MRCAGVGRPSRAATAAATALAAISAAMAFAASAQAIALTGGTLAESTRATALVGGAGTSAGTADAGAVSGDVPSHAEVDAAIAALRNRTAGIRELKAPPPDWFTPNLDHQVRENGMAPAPVDAPLPGQVGIRPGSMMVSPFICTMNYIFQRGDTVAIGTAGHCLEENEPVVLLTVAPTGGNPVLVELGKVLLKQNAGIGRDYGLVEVPPERRDWVFPTIADIGGPCGSYSGGDPQPVAHYGHGLVGGFPGTPRAGMGFELTDQQQQDLSSIAPIKGVDWDWDDDSIVWAGYLYGGDSGSPVRIGQLPAVANLTHGIGMTGLEPSVVGWGTRVTTVTSSGWTLVNSPLCPPAVLADDSGGDTGSGSAGGHGSGKSWK
jgi:hypothetical protein